MFAVYEKRPYVYYAVQPYGIGGVATNTYIRPGKDAQPTNSDDVVGITFGPATGNMFSDSTNDLSYVSGKYMPMVNAHAVSDSTYLINDNSISDGTATATESYSYIAVDKNTIYGKSVSVRAGSTLAKGQTTITPSQVKADMDAVQSEGEAAITTSKAAGQNVIIGNDAGTDAAGNAYRCIHYDNWNTILYWNNHDPHVYDKCVINHCSKRLALPATPAFGMNMDLFRYLPPNAANLDNDVWLARKENFIPYGDGDSFIAYCRWNQWRNYNDHKYIHFDEYSASFIRAKLVGADKYTSEDASCAGIDAKIKLTENNSVYRAFPEIIRNQIGAKELYDYSFGKKFDASTNIDGANGPYYDKLWLFSVDETKTEEDSTRANSKGLSIYRERNSSDHKNIHTISYLNLWTRNLTYDRGRWDGTTFNQNYLFGIARIESVAPGFVLKRNIQ